MFESLPHAITDHIPLEIYENIIAFLRFDPHSLSTCALVCKAWLLSSQLLLFHDVLLHQHNFNLFLDLLNSPESAKYIRSHVYRITMVEMVREDHRWLDRCLPYMTGFSTKILNICGEGFTDYFSNISEPPSLSSLQSITELELTSIKFYSRVVVFDTICELRNLERISLDHVLWNWDPWEVNTGSQLPSSLHVLELRLWAPDYREDPFFLHEVMRWIVECHMPLPCLHTLTLCTGKLTRRRAVRMIEFHQLAKQVLAGLGSSLQHFTISNLDIVPEDLLSYNTELRTLHIEDIDLRGTSDASSTPWIPDLLDTVASPHIREIRFTIKLDRIEDLDGLDWATITQTLSEPKFAHLDRIEFNVLTLKMGEGEEEVASSIQPRLPDFLRGVVHVRKGKILWDER